MESPLFSRRCLSLLLVTLIVGWLAVPAAALEPGELDPASFDAMLKKYVHDGWVDYKAWKANDQEALDAFLAASAEFDLNSIMGKEPRASFLINAHNAWAVRQILEHYPVNSITEIPGFYHRNEVKIAGEMHTLKTLEAKTAGILPHRPTFAFALAPGTVGGPRLQDTAFTSESFLTLLDKYAVDYLVTKKRIRYDADTKEVHIPPQLLAHIEDYMAFPKGIAEALSSYVALEVLMAMSYGQPHFVVDPQDLSLNDVSRRPAKSP